MVKVKGFTQDVVGDEISSLLFSLSLPKKKLTRAPFDSVQGAQEERSRFAYGAQHNAGLWWAGVHCAMHSHDHDCGG